MSTIRTSNENHPPDALPGTSRTRTRRAVYRPAMPTPGPKDLHESTLCVRCRYDLIGLEFDGLCPECGLPIEASRWRWATGSPWQLERTVASIGPAWLALFLNPSESVLRIWLTDRFANRLLIQTAGVIAIAPAAILWPISFVMGPTAGWFMLVMAALVAAILWPTLIIWQSIIAEGTAKGIPSFDRRSALNMAAHLSFLLLPVSLGVLLMVLPLALSLGQIVADTPPPPAFMYNPIYFGSNLFVIWLFGIVLYPAAIYFAAKHRAQTAKSRA